MNLEEYVKFHSPGYVIETYKKGVKNEYVYGNRETVPEVYPVLSDTLYDIASLTKVYTATLVYIAYEEGKLRLGDCIYDLDSRFINLKNVMVCNLLNHGQEIWTDGYLGNAKDKEEFYKILFSAYVKNYLPTYVDVHYIILSTVLETVYQKSFEELLQEKIFSPLRLEKTTVFPKGDNIASNNYETLNGEVARTNTPGLIHDTKGRVAKSFGIITGHASIFTTAHELMLFLESFFNYSLLSKETIARMLDHEDRNGMNSKILFQYAKRDKVDKMYEEAIKNNPSIKFVPTYNNMGTRYRNMISAINDVPKICSKNTIVFSGYTGPMFLIDFSKKIIIVIMCNVMHNTRLDRNRRKKITEEILNQIYVKMST